MNKAGTEQEGRGTSVAIISLSAIILIAGAVFRLIYLGHSSLQIDEINVIRDAVNQPGYGAIISAELERFTWYHRLPMLMLIIRFFAKNAAPAGGYPPEWIARLPFALMGIIALPVFYFLGRLVRNRKAGLWAMFLCAFSVFHIYYSREAYDYSMIVLFSAVVLWSSLALLRNWADKSRPFIRWAVLYAVGAGLFLQAHMSCLLFLASWNVLFCLVLLWNEGWNGVFKNRRFVYLAPALVFPYLLFAPFLIRLFGGYSSTDISAHTIYFTWASIPALLGRMGWGESIYVLIPFSLILIFGAISGIKESEGKMRRQFILLLISFFIYGVLQSVMLNRSQSRFEIRYYTPFFPILILTAALGLERLASCLGRKLEGRKTALIHVVVALPICLWALPFIWNVTQLKCRGYNYKGIAQWVNRNIKDNGVYAFYNVYELRGVPAVYPTPGRFGTSAAVWSSQEDFDRVNPPNRVFSLFSRFPLATFIEIGPGDILTPESDTSPIDREHLFMNQLWLDDPAWNRLLKWKVFPPGEVQINAANMSKVLISWNRPEDLPQLALRRNQQYYHYFGSQWGYIRDRQYNDWRHIQTGQSADIFLGNVMAEERIVDLQIQAMAPPSACWLSIMDAGGNQLTERIKVGPSAQLITIPSVKLAPGLSKIRIKAIPVSQLVQGNLLIYAIQIRAHTEDNNSQNNSN